VKQTDPIEADAARITAHLDAIRRVLRDSVWAQARRFSVPLTPPQILVLQHLVDHTRDTGTGLSLSELSARMGLAHSTVSGIVTRLEARNLLRRTTHPQDRRFVRIELTEPVKEWLERDLPAIRLGPVAAAIRTATIQERASILDGLATLERLLSDKEDPPDRGGDDRTGHPTRKRRARR
jgi:DNA-binding MarR family transcriptional regulator